MTSTSSLLRRIRTAARRRVPAGIQTALLRGAAGSHLRKGAGLRLSSYQRIAVLARTWKGPFSVQDLADSHLERFTSLLREAGIDYFVARSGNAYHHAVGIPARQRTETVALLEEHYTDRGYYLRNRNGYVLLSRNRLRKGRDADVLRIGEYTAGAHGSVVTGPAHGLSIEFWEEGSRVLKEPDGDSRLAELRVVAPESVLRESLVAPQLNPVCEVLPAEARKPATVTVGGATHPTLEAFTWDLATDIDFPIDAVYTWVDGDDEEWAAKRNRYLGGGTELNPDSVSRARYTSRDELRYSLRSLEMFAPFIRNIYIVTDGQCPSWLRTDHPRVCVVDHKEIFDDPSVLPVFNSHAIESQLHHIPGLAEHYLYLNDDVLLGRPVTADKFFHPNGIAKLNPSTYRFGLGPPSVEDQPVDAAAKQNSLLIGERFGKVPTTKFKHTPIPQRRSVLEELEREYPQVFAATAASRFRHPGDHSIPSSLHNYHALLTGRAVMGRLRYTYLNMADAEAVRKRTRELLANRNHDSFCVNDTTTPGDDTSARLVDAFFRDFFPSPSSFEK
ncbi:stealth conserved region 3 domain-containing protein [Nocardiopsis algeriensis]|uniref:stealth family protein n=1 Tax=Nocardiopsis algeriensis TaxID=1478215 RepID=UPI003B43D341